MQQIADWLKELGMSEYVDRFAENHIDIGVLRDLTDQDLKDLGVVSIGHRRKMLRAISELAEAGIVPSRPPATSLSKPTSASASQITVDPSGETALIVIEGRLDQGDEDLFRARIADVHNLSVVVGLNSPGGDLHAGIEIGTIVRRMRGFATSVPAAFERASACGLIWLAGTPRTVLYDDAGNYGRVPVAQSRPPM
jgi:hypothetical protein